MFFLHLPFYFSIASYLQSRDHGRYSRKYIDNLIDREVTACNIASISKETFTLPPSVLKSLDRRWKHEHMKSKRKASGGAEDLNKSKNQINKNKSVPSKVEKSPPPTPPRPERVGQRMKVRCYVQMTRGNATIIKCFWSCTAQRAKKVFDPSDVEVVPRKRGRPVGTGKKNRELRNSFATTPERSKSPFLLTGSSPPNSYSHSEFKACLLCKYYTVILRGVTSKMLVCCECNRNGEIRFVCLFLFLFCFVSLKNCWVLWSRLRADACFVIQFTPNAWDSIRTFCLAFPNRNGSAPIAALVAFVNWSKNR